MATYVEPIGFGVRTYGPFADELEASLFMDEHEVSDADHKVVTR